MSNREQHVRAGNVKHAIAQPRRNFASNHSNIPAELKLLPQWVVAGDDKVPLITRTLRPASVSDPDTWSTFDDASAAAKSYSLYVGFVFTEHDPYTGIDLDEPVSDEEQQRHILIYDSLLTYTELSRSGKGVLQYSSN